MVIDNPNIPPPPIPCITLPAISVFILFASAPTREPMRNTIMAASRMGLRPKMSLIFPRVE